jgi:hypothetical protein
MLAAVPRRLPALLLVALCGLWPDYAHGRAALAGVCHDVGGSAVAPGGLAVPHRVQLVGRIDHELAGGHVGFGGGLGERQAVYGGGVGEQVVVLRLRVRREPGAVFGGGDDRFEGAAEVGDGAGEDLVGSVGQAGDTGYVGGAFGEGGPDGLVD